MPVPRPRSTMRKIREILRIYSVIFAKMCMNTPQSLQTAKPPAVEAYVRYQYTVMIAQNDVAYYTFSVYYDPDLSGRMAGYPG